MKKIQKIFTFRDIACDLYNIDYGRINSQVQRTVLDEGWYIDQISTTSTGGAETDECYTLTVLASKEVD